MREYPSVREQFGELLLRGLFHIRHPCDDIVQIGPRVHVVVAACGEQRCDDAHVAGSLVVAAEEPVLAS